MAGNPAATHNHRLSRPHQKTARLQAARREGRLHCGSVVFEWRRVNESYRTRLIDWLIVLLKKGERETLEDYNGARRK